MHVTTATTKTHIGRLLAKLAARDRAQLVIVAYVTRTHPAGLKYATRRKVASPGPEVRPGPARLGPLARH